MIIVRRATKPTHWKLAAALLTAYVDWIRAEARFDPYVEQPAFADEVGRLAELYRGRRGALFLAVRDGVAVGTVAVRCHPDRSAELKRMYVAAEARGSGCADALMAAAGRFAAGLGCRELWLESVAGAMEPAIGVYRRNGFEPDGNRAPTLAVRGVVVMSRRLGAEFRFGPPLPHTRKEPTCPASHAG